MRNRSGFASHLHKYLLIVIKLNRNTQCTSGVRREFNLRYKRKVKLRVSVWVNVWVCRLWVCILHHAFGCLISCLRWGEVLLLPFWGSLQKEPSALFLPTCQPEPRGQLDKIPYSSHRKSLGVWRPPRAQSGWGGAAPRSWPPPSPREGVQVPVGRGAPELSSLAPGRPRPACVCVRCGVRVCLSCKPSLPKPTPPTVCHSIQIWKQVFKKQHDAQRGRGGGRAVALGPQISESLIVRTWGGGAGGAGPHITKVHRSAPGRRSPRAGRGIPGPGQADRLSQNLLA